jgi:hypothetical protein
MRGIPTFMTRLLSWLLLLGLFGVFVAVVAWALVIRLDAGVDLPAYSVYSENPHNGLAESARLLRQLGWEPRALTRLVSPNQKGLLILAQPENPVLLGELEDDLSPADVQNLLQWVEQGNTLLLCDTNVTNLHRHLHVDVNHGDADDLVTADLGEAGAYLEGVERLVVKGRNSLSSPRGLPLWWVDGKPGALLISQGRGRILVTPDPTLLTPRGLRRGDNLVFLYNVAALNARAGRVYYDEYHHGLRSGGGFFDYLWSKDQMWTVVPILLVVAIGCWCVAVRLGPAAPLPLKARADAVDYASALARIYRRAGARRLVGRTLARNFVASLTRYLRLRRAALPAEILAAWRQRHPRESTERLQGLLRGLATLRTGTVSDQGLLTWCQDFDEFLAEVVHAC